ncbi:hypothetical protein [Micromonospora sp. NPDC005979]|uniref:hypothetical protein n=1 Tax=Micromonospora sp. NPDC005979 TaxID=3156726 RepID=UPI00339EA633
MRTSMAASHRSRCRSRSAAAGSPGSAASRRCSAYSRRQAGHHRPARRRDVRRALEQHQVVRLVHGAHRRVRLVVAGRHRVRARLDPPPVQPPVRRVAGAEEPDVRVTPQLLAPGRGPVGALLAGEGELVGELPAGAAGGDQPGQGGGAQRGQ